MKNEVSKVGEGLVLARQCLSSRSENASLDGEVLLAHLLGKPRSWILAHPEAQIPTGIYQDYKKSIERLANGEPLPYLVGRQEFYGLEFEVNPQVLIPRPETELLVEQAIQWLKEHPGRRRGVDVGTGSGCIAAALSTHIPDLYITATDISTDVIETARRNLRRHDLVDRVQLVKTNLLEGLTGPFDIICANLPYIPTETLEGLTVGRFEPRLALDGGVDGLTVVWELFQQAKGCLAQDGLLLAEIEASQGLKVYREARGCFPGKRVDILKDLAGLDRLVRVG